MEDQLNKMPIQTDVEVTPQNPFTIDIPGDKERFDGQIAHPGFPVEEEKPGFFETAKAEFEENSTNYHVLHAAAAPLTKPAGIQVQYFYPDVNDKYYKPTQAGWTPKEEINKLPNLDPKFLPRLMDAKSPDDFHYRLDDIYRQQNNDQALENGSTWGKIFGGLVAYSPIGSIEDFIPLASIANKAKVASGFLSSATRNFPSVLAASAIREGAKQMDGVEKSTSTFLKDTFVDAAFATVFFGAAGAIKPALNAAEFNRIKDFAKSYLDGIGYEYVIGEKGELKGFKAVDISDGSVGAAKVTKAQELADSAFYKGGLFKIPYIGDTTLSVISGNVSQIPGVANTPVLKDIAAGVDYLVGSPLVKVLTSKYKNARAFGNSAFDHFITTEGEQKGGTRPPSFELKVKMMQAQLTDLKMQTTALHAERNGYNITSRPTIGIQNAWSAVKQKTIQALSKETQSTDYVGYEDFMDEVQHVLYSSKSSEHSAVNSMADIYRKVIDTTYKDYRTAHNLPEDWLPPKTATSYLMRVYDTKFMNENEGLWNNVVSNWLKESDAQIEQMMQPINETKMAIKSAQESHESLIKSGNASDAMVTESARNIEGLQRKATKLHSALTNRMRSDGNLFIHIDDPSAVSHAEAKEIKQLLKPKEKKQKLVDYLQKEVDEIKNKSFFAKGKASKARTMEKATEKLAESEKNAALLEQKSQELKIAKDAVMEEEFNLQDKMANNEVKSNLYYKIHDSNQYALKDSSNLLKFRDTYESDWHREQAAKAYYDSIMNLSPQDTIADIFGKLTGKKEENALKSRTLLIPDEVLYDSNFMTKDLYTKTANYVNYLGRRTHLKTSFQDVTVNGGFEELGEGLLNEYKENRDLINKKLESTTDPKEIEKAKKDLRKEATEFNGIKKVMKTLYEERMMGLNKRKNFDSMARRTWMSLTAAANLHNLPATQITDLGFVGFQHGLWPFVRDGVYPIINSMSGIMKTKDSEALREMAPHLHLGMQDALNNYADRNWHSELQPDVNMGKFVSGVEKYAHFSALTDLSPYVDNGIQHVTGSVVQSRFMELLHKHLESGLSDKESLYLRKYGIDPNQWAERMINAYKGADGFKTKLGGYVSKAWEWQDLEASNVFNTAAFRAIQNTLVWKGMADSPFFADNILGLFFHTFTGWGYAATNRYLIPSLQHPDAELLLKMAFMGSVGAMVSPLRRLTRGEDLWPQDMTPQQIAWEAFSDSGVFSSVANVLNMANFLTDDKLLGNLKNDKYRNRVRTGVFGMSDIVSSTATRIADVFGMAQSGIDKKDLKTAAHMLPITGAMYGHYISDKLIDNSNIPNNKSAAEAQ